MLYVAKGLRNERADRPCRRWNELRPLRQEQVAEPASSACDQHGNTPNSRGSCDYSIDYAPSGQERYLREVQLLDKHTFEVFFDKLTFIYLEMPRFKKREEDLVIHFDKWLYVLKNLHKLQARPQKLQEKVFEKLFAEAELAKLSPDEMRTYEESLKVYRDYYSIIETAKNEGRQEERIELAKRLKYRGMDIEIIAETTGLTKEQIEKL